MALIGMAFANSRVRFEAAMADGEEKDEEGEDPDVHTIRDSNRIDGAYDVA